MEILKVLLKIFKQHYIQFSVIQGLSKSPGERLKNFMGHNAFLLQFWRMAQKMDHKTYNSKTLNKSNDSLK